MKFVNKTLLIQVEVKRSWKSLWSLFDVEWIKADEVSRGLPSCTVEHVGMLEGAVHVLSPRKLGVKLLWDLRAPRTHCLFHSNDAFSAIRLHASVRFW